MYKQVLSESFVDWSSLVLGEVKRSTATQYTKTCTAKEVLTVVQYSVTVPSSSSTICTPSNSHSISYKFTTRKSIAGLLAFTSRRFGLCAFSTDCPNANRTPFRSSHLQTGLSLMLPSCLHMPTRLMTTPKSRLLCMYSSLIGCRASARFLACSSST